MAEKCLGKETLIYFVLQNADYILTANIFWQRAKELFDLFFNTEDYKRSFKFWVSHTCF